MGAWYRLGWGKGPTAASALQAWVKGEGRRCETYGVRSPDEVHCPADSSVKDELRAAAR